MPSNAAPPTDTCKHLYTHTDLNTVATLTFVVYL